MSEFAREERGPYLFNVWTWSHRVPTRVGDLPVEIHTSMGTIPSREMVHAASELAEYAGASGERVLDVIYAHYRYAEERGWLDFRNVPSGLSRDTVLSQVESIYLAVDEEGPGAFIEVDPLWDPEHKLSLSYRSGEIVEVNGQGYSLEGDSLRW